MKTLANIYRDPRGPILRLVSLMALTTWALGPAVTGSAQTAAARWTYTGNLNSRRGGHTGTLLPNGKVLVVGGNRTGSVELYDPSTGTWSIAGSLSVPREAFTSTLLRSGRVLVAGGWAASSSGGVWEGTNTAELYDPVTGTWSLTGNLNIAREFHTATLLQDGKVLVAGGAKYADIDGNLDLLRDSEVYDPTTGTWS